MNNSNKLKTIDYTFRTLSVVVGLTILVLLITSIISGIIAILLTALALLLIVYGILGIKKIFR